MISLFGAGEMGEALLAGLVRSGHATEEILVVEPRAERAEELKWKYGVTAVAPQRAAEAADTVLIVVRPQHVADLLDDIAPHLDPGCLIVSAAAGIPTRFVERRLGGETPVIRVMPNTPVLVESGMCVISPGRHATEEHLRRAQHLLSPVGKVILLDEECQDAATALSGSAPAYFFYVIENMIKAGTELGVPEEAARDMVLQAAEGAVALIRGTGEAPGALRESVTSPGGTTQAAVTTLVDEGVGRAIREAVDAAAHRSRELGERYAGESGAAPDA
ncbi:pyrroline-5-carboxylate reductase [Streptomyces sp. NPDC006458]|uniref:pyrroline-5-carboxylate reductase n=1 Tax=Streptomyces sp. NPDC006458 TaxID=3154302 RepID=UPI0033A528E3